MTKGKLENFFSIEQGLKLLKDISYTVIIEDYEEGLKVETNVKKGNIASLLDSPIKKYGGLFSFRIFNENEEIYWNGEEGIYTEKFENNGHWEIEEKVVDLETDIGRHIGLTSFTIKGYEKILVQIFRKGDEHFWKFKSFIKGGNSETKPKSMAR